VRLRDFALLQWTIDLLLDPAGASATLLGNGGRAKPIAEKDIVAMLRILGRSQEGVERVWGAMHTALENADSLAARSR